MKLTCAATFLLAAVQLQSALVGGFSVRPVTGTSVRLNGKPSSQTALTSVAASTGEDGVATGSVAETKKQDKKKQLRQEGGLFAFNTKYGALNPFAIYYGLVAILFGIPWFLALSVVQFLYLITGNRFDRQRRIPVHINQIWGTILMFLTRSYPKMENRDILKKHFASKRPAMFVANHSSWDDIPLLGGTIGFRNYKIVAKKELEKVPILGKAIKVAGNVEVDRSDRKSQLATLKKGIQYLKDGVNLCTFAEGTRSRSGRLMKFKDGAFKMAHKAGAPVIPIAIVGAFKSHPPHWMFPARPTRNIAKVVVCEPIESVGITEAELSSKVRQSLIEALPEEQRPLNE